MPAAAAELANDSRQAVAEAKADENNNDGWTTVRSSSRRSKTSKSSSRNNGQTASHKAGRKVPQSLQASDGSDSIRTEFIDLLGKRVKDALTRWKSTACRQIVIKYVEGRVAHVSLADRETKPRPKQIIDAAICVGLGSFDESTSGSGFGGLGQRSIWQFVLFLDVIEFLRDHLITSSPAASSTGSNGFEHEQYSKASSLEVILCDPAFTPFDEQFFASFRFETFRTLSEAVQHRGSPLTPGKDQIFLFAPFVPWNVLLLEIFAPLAETHPHDHTFKPLLYIGTSIRATVEALELLKVPVEYVAPSSNHHGSEIMLMERQSIRKKTRKRESIAEEVFDGSEFRSVSLHGETIPAEQVRRCHEVASSLLQCQVADETRVPSFDLHEHALHGLCITGFGSVNTVPGGYEDTEA